MLEIALPWPAIELSPNSRVHWRLVAAAKRIARLEAYALAQQVRGEIKLDARGCLRMEIVFHFPDDRARDSDNCLTMLKSARDGIADALGTNDKIFWPLVVDYGENMPGGQVVVRIGNTISDRKG